MKKTKKNLLIAFFIVLLCIIYSYICAIDSIPTNIVLFNGEKLKYKTIYGISFNNFSSYTSVQTSTLSNKDQVNNNRNNLEVRLFGKIKLKDIGIDIIERKKVIPVGKISGLKLYTHGVLVVGMSEITGIDNKKYKPYEKSGIEEGDIIVEIGDTIINDIDELIKVVNSSDGKSIKIKYLRDNQEFVSEVKPIKTSKNEYKLGLWVRDSAAGIGTMTFYDAETKCFAALGHGITDIDTGNLLDISNGEFITTKVLSITKGKEGIPRKNPRLYFRSS